MARTNRAIIADGFREIDQRMAGIETLLQQLLTVCRDTADGLHEHRSHTLRDVSDLGADVNNLKGRVSHLEKAAANGGE